MNLNEILEDLHHELLYNSTLSQEDIDVIIDKIKNKHAAIKSTLPVDFKYCKKCNSDWFHKRFPKTVSKKDNYCTKCESKLEYSFYGSYCKLCHKQYDNHKYKKCQQCNNDTILGLINNQFDGLC